MLDLFFILADPVNLFTHGLQTGTRRADTGKETNDPQHNHDPYAKFKPVLEIDAQHKKHTGGKQARKTDLTHPSQ